MVHASWVESDGFEDTNFLMGIELDIAPKDTESFHVQLSHLMVIVADCTVVSSMVAANLHAAMEHQTVHDRATNGSRLSDAYYMSLQSCLSRFELDGLFSVEDSSLVRSTRFTNSLGKLLQRTEMVDDEWPLANGNNQPYETVLPPGMEDGFGRTQCLLGERLSSAVVNVPPMGRMLELKVAQMLHPKNSAMMTKYMNDAYTTGATFMGATHSLQGYVIDASLKDANIDIDL